MRQEKAIEVSGRKVVVREITVAEMRAWLRSLDQADERQDGAGLQDLVNLALFEDVSLSDICRMTDLKENDLDEMAPSEIGEVLAVCKEMNPSFFGLHGRLRAVARRAAQRLVPDSLGRPPLN